MKLAVFAVLLLVFPVQAAGGCIGKNVQVMVKKGKGLTGDGQFKPDPYVLVKIGNGIQNTRVIQGNANPTWNQKLVFKNVKTNLMEISVLEADKGKKADQLLGTCTKRLAPKGKGDIKNIKCVTDNKKGVVYLAYRCV